MANITVYSKPACVQCNATKREMDKKGIKYDIVDISQDPAAADHIRELGFMQAPVVITSDTEWSGFRPDKIKELAESVSEPALA